MNDCGCLVTTDSPAQSDSLLPCFRSSLAVCGGRSGLALSCSGSSRLLTPGTARVRARVAPHYQTPFTVRYQTSLSILYLSSLYSYYILCFSLKTKISPYKSCYRNPQCTKYLFYPLECLSETQGLWGSRWTGLY